MAPPALVVVEEMEVEHGSPPENEVEEQFATPRSSTEQPPTTEDLDQRNAAADARDNHGHANAQSVDIVMKEAPVQQETRSAPDRLPESSRQSSSIDVSTPTTKHDRVGFPISRAPSTSSPQDTSRPPQPVSSSSTPAPSQNTPQSLADEKELLRLKQAIDGVSPHVLHKFLRTNWRDLLFNPIDDDHIAYIIRACMKNADPAVVERGLKDALNLPKHRSNITAKVLKHITVTDASKFLPENVLDAILIQRVESLPPKHLVNMLADANRLGYRRDDYTEESKLSKEDVFPVHRGQVVEDPHPMAINQPTASTTLHSNVPAGYEVHSFPEQDKQAEIQRQKLAIQHQRSELERRDLAPLPPPPHHAIPNGNLNLKCYLCHFQCSSRTGFNYHTIKKVCQRQPQSASWSWGCANCGQKFTTKQGQNYHLLKKVCDNEGNDSGEVIESISEPPAKANFPQGVPQIPHQNRDPIHPPARPTFSTAPRPSAPQIEQNQPRSAMQVQLSRPPMHTPAAVPLTPQAHDQRSQKAGKSQPAQPWQDIDPTARVSPSQLSAAKKAELERQIQAEDERYERALASIDPQWPKEDQDKRRISLKNGNASKKSQIRKSFGVTLRMREKDKLASRAIAQSSPGPTDGPSSRASPSIPAHISSPASGFSPINVPPRHNPTPPNGYPLPNNRHQQHNLPPLRPHDESDDANGSAFGVLTQPRAKRQRTSSNTEAPNPLVGNWIPSSTGGVQTLYKPGMQEIISSEDANKKYPPKKVPIGAAQARWEALQPQNGSTTPQRVAQSDDEMADAPVHAPAPPTSAPAPAPAVARVTEIIDIQSSDDGGDAAPPRKDVAGADADKLLPSTEDTESEETGSSRPPSSGGVRGVFMAKRGGRRGEEAGETRPLSSGGAYSTFPATRGDETAETRPLSSSGERGAFTARRGGRRALPG